MSDAANFILFVKELITIVCVLTLPCFQGVRLFPSGKLKHDSNMRSRDRINAIPYLQTLLGLISNANSQR
ncbi:hypothetical protein [Calothrix sp. NIES-2100]|uniref:hypothetical protein n=1 Tax=Calothrix sp. NIES-2100 TaxID=1954172 RepID=UPI0030DA9F7B